MAVKQNNINKLLKFCFWNARSINQRRNELPDILKNLDIFICVESWLADNDKNNDYIFSSDFVQYKKNRTYAVGGGILSLLISLRISRNVRH